MKLVAITALMGLVAAIVPGNSARANEGRYVETNRVQSYEAVKIDLEASWNARAQQFSDVKVRARHVTYGKEGNVLASRPVKAGSISVRSRADVPAFQCGIKRSTTEKLTTHAPLELTMSGNSLDATWIIQPYSVDFARVVDGVPTFQYEMCAAGVGDVWNEWRQYFNGIGVTLNASGPRRISHSWGTNEKIRSNMMRVDHRFEIADGSVTIGAAAAVTPIHTFTGSLGADEHMQGWPYSPSFDINRVNSYFLSPREWIWDGSDQVEGNVLHGLYEFSRDDPEIDTFGVRAQAQVHAFCGKLKEEPPCVPFQ